MSNHADSSRSWCVYILRCNDDSLYTGITLEPQRRVAEHNSDDKLAARYTRGRRPVTLVYAEYCPDRATASRREAEIKKLSRPQKLTLIQQGLASVIGDA